MSSWGVLGVTGAAATSLASSPFYEICCYAAGIAGNAPCFLISVPFIIAVFNLILFNKENCHSVFLGFEISVI
jgi:hypothetical protein